MRNKFQKRLIFWLGFIPILSLTIFFAIFPLAWALISSFIPQEALLTSKIPIFDLTLTHYKDLFILTDFATYLKNSIIIGMIATTICIVISTLAAYSFSRFKHRWPMERLMVLTYIIPPVLLVIPIFLVFRRLHLTNNYLGVALGQATFMLPFATLMMVSFFRNIPKHLDEAALIDGCTRIKVLTKVILPMSLPGIVSTGIIVFAFSWNDYLYAYSLTSSPSLKTIPLGIQQFSQSMYTQWGMLMAAAIVTTLPVLIFFLIIQKRLMEGLVFSPSQYK